MAAWAGGRPVADGIPPMWTTVWPRTSVVTTSSSSQRRSSMPSVMYGHAPRRVDVALDHEDPARGVERRAGRRSSRSQRRPRSPGRRTGSSRRRPGSGRAPRPSAGRRRPARSSPMPSVCRSASTPTRSSSPPSSGATSRAHPLGADPAGLDVGGVEADGAEQQRARRRRPRPSGGAQGRDQRGDQTTATPRIGSVTNTHR